MRIARYTTGEDPAYGIVEGEPGQEVVAEIQGDPLYQPVVPTGVQVPLEEVRLLAPVIPRSKVIGIGKNYADHAAEMGGEAPAEPLMFLIPNTAVVGPGDPVVLPRQTSEVHYEGELAVVIGRICKDVPRRARARTSSTATPAPTTSPRATCSEPTASGRGPRGSTRSARSARGSRPTSTPPTCALVTRRDGEVVQDGTTADMVHDVADARRVRLRRPSRCCPATSSSPGRPPASARSSAASGSRSRSRASAPCPTPSSPAELDAAP